MTIDEAIKDIKDNIKPVVGGISLDMAIDALEKQIPMKPMHPQMGIDGRKIVPCGYCEEELPENMLYDYCPYCGQKIER